MKTILHIFVDDKFPKDVYQIFKEDGRTNNKCAVFNLKHRNLKYVGGIEGLVVLDSNVEVKEFLQTEKYDIVFFHSLSAWQWFSIKHIPSDRIVIWWSWGFDLYDLPYGLEPFIEVDLFKPLSRKLARGSFQHRIKNILDWCKYPLYAKKRNTILARIDYFQPVISLELAMMKHNRRFRAEEFYYPGSMPVNNNPIISVRKAQGAIMYCNSAHLTNNHLDVALEMNKACLSGGRDIFIPLSYGVSKYAGYLKEHLTIKGAKLHFLEELLPAKDYFEIMDSCSYFVSGIMRQQSMGNISYCLKNGIKVFLYRDSIVYKYLTEAGCYVFPVEEINENSFSLPLSVEEAEQNRLFVEKEAKRRDNVWENFLESN